MPDTSLVAHLQRFGYVDHKMRTMSFIVLINLRLLISSRGIDYANKYNQSRSLVSQSKNEVSAELMVKLLSVHWAKVS